MVVGFDLEDFITNDCGLKLPDFSEPGMVEQTIFTERYYTYLGLRRYKDRIIYDGKDYYFYNEELDYWKQELFMGVKIWGAVLDHFRREEEQYKSALDKDFMLRYHKKLLTANEDEQKAIKKHHPNLQFNKLMVKLHKSHTACLNKDDLLASLCFNDKFATMCNPVGYINCFKIEQVKEWKQHDDFDGEEYFEMIDRKTPIMIDLNSPGSTYQREPKYFMTNELDVVVGQSDDYQLSELENILIDICNGSRDRMQQVLLGYIMALKGTDKHYTFCHTGNGSNGKSILTALLQATFKPFVLTVDSVELLKKSKGSRDKFHSSLTGKRLLLIEELDESEVDTEELKILSGNAQISYKGLYRQNTIDINYTGRLFINKNNELNVGTKGNDGGLARRIKIIEHSNKFVSPEEKEKYPDNDKIIEGDGELEKRIKNGEYSGAFFDLVLQLISSNVVENWQEEFGKETNELLDDCVCDITEWARDRIVRCSEEDLDPLTLHAIMDEISNELPNVKKKEVKNKLKQYFKQRFPNTVIEECRYYHDGKRERGVTYSGCRMLDVVEEIADEIDPLDL